MLSLRLQCCATDMRCSSDVGVRYVRYMQWGVWSAIFRPHDGGNDDTRIWMFAEPYASILRDCTRLRGALTPYVYSLAAKSSSESWYVRRSCHKQRPWFKIVTASCFVADMDK